MSDPSASPGGRRGPEAEFLPPPAPHVLREYALLADGYRGALVGPAGNIGWLCAPGWDSAAVFSGLLGGDGCFTVTPANPRFVWGGYQNAGPFRAGVKARAGRTAKARAVP